MSRSNSPGIAIIVKYSNGFYQPVLGVSVQRTPGVLSSSYRAVMLPLASFGPSCCCILHASLKPNSFFLTKAVFINNF